MSSLEHRQTKTNSIKDPVSGVHKKTKIYLFIYIEHEGLQHRLTPRERTHAIPV